jgi:hypothetical protein
MMRAAPVQHTTKGATVHSLIHPVYANTVAADRIRAVPRSGVARPRRHRPPPVRRHVAYVVARVAGRLDAESARRAVA